MAASRESRPLEMPRTPKRNGELRKAPKLSAHFQTTDFLERRLIRYSMRPAGRKPSRCVSGTKPRNREGSPET